MRARLTGAQFIIFAQPKERFVGLTNTRLTRGDAREGRLHSIMIAGQPQAAISAPSHKSRSGASIVRNISGPQTDLESVYHPAAYARRIDRLMSMLGLDAAERIAYPVTSVSRYNAGDCASRLTAIPEANDPFWRIFLNCAKRNSSSERFLT